MTTNQQLIDMTVEADEQLRTMCHVLINTRSTPAPLVYDLVPRFAGIGSKLEQLCGYLAAGLENSLEEYDVYDRNRDPAESVAMAKEQFAVAIYAARTFWEAMNKAQSAINLQGYNLPAEPTPASFGEVLDDLLENGDRE